MGTDVREVLVLSGSAGVLDLRVDDSPHEIDVFWPQATRLGQTEPNKRTQEHSKPDALRKQVIELPDLFGGRHVHPLLSQVRGCSP